MAFRVQIRRDPSGKWIVNNPILLSGELGYETDTTFLKIGDGATTWNNLPYWNGGQGPVGPTGASGATYKVFTALLTQSGGDDEQFMSDDIYLVKGVTYEIVANDVPNFNFVPYGAPNNNNGTKFIANETITFIGIIDCSLSYNTGAPVATVLENTIGNVWFTYDGVGNYGINSNNLFTSNKTASFISGLDASSGSGGGSPLGGGTSIIILDSSNLSFFVIDTISNPIDSVLSGYPIEIRVYN